MTNIASIKMENISKIDMESEGDQNGFFSIILKDKTTYDGWSCGQGSFTELETDEQVPEWINNLLFDLWHRMPCDEEGDDRTFASFTPFPRNNNTIWIMSA